MSFTRAAIPLITLLLVFGNAVLQGWIARTNAEEIVQASEQYRSKNGVYPKKLDDLVPVYLSSVPLAKYALAGKFEYSSNPGGHMLSWLVIPPFYACDYYLEEARLRCRD